MDDFLHNLRSGKLKQHDRSNRSYNDQQYKGSQRRNAMDRRKKGSDSFEQMNAVKELLESISETQKRMAAAQEAAAKSEERKAKAMETIAKNIYRLLNPAARDADALFSQKAPVALNEATEKEENIPAQDLMESDASGSLTGKLTAETKKVVFDLIGKMRENGNSWEKIARSIAEQGYPTISGKGSWRGVMAKSLYEKMTVG